MVPVVAATAITWSLVRITPSAAMIAPLPDPDDPPPLAKTVTTAGRTFWATATASQEVARPGTKRVATRAPTAPPTKAVTRPPTRSVRQFETGGEELSVIPRE